MTLRLPLPCGLALALLAAACADDAPGGDAAGAEPPSAPAEGAAGRAYAPYTNARFGFSLVYPRDLLTPLRPPRGGEDDGFLARGAGAELRAYARYDARAEALEEARRRAAEAFDTLTYAARLDSGFVLSGYGNGRITYTKVVRQRGVLYTLELDYDRARRATFDPVVERVAESFPEARPATLLGR